MPFGGQTPGTPPGRAALLSRTFVPAKACATSRKLNGDCSEQRTSSPAFDAAWQQPQRLKRSVSQQVTSGQGFDAPPCRAASCCRKSTRQCRSSAPVGLLATTRRRVCETRSHRPNARSEAPPASRPTPQPPRSGRRGDTTAPPRWRAARPAGTTSSPRGR